MKQKKKANPALRAYRGALGAGLRALTPVAEKTGRAIRKASPKTARRVEELAGLHGKNVKAASPALRAYRKAIGAGLRVLTPVAEGAGRRMSRSQAASVAANARWHGRGRKK